MTKWTTADIPDQTGRTAVITGANTGLGYETAAGARREGRPCRARRPQSREGQEPQRADRTGHTRRHVNSKSST